VDFSLLNGYFDNAGLVICADGGALHLKRFGIKPDILLGDFDSISQEVLHELELDDVEIIRYPVHKDKTDSELALEIAAERGCTEIILLGAMGTRMDHTLANIMLLKKLALSGIRGVIADEHNEIRLILEELSLEVDNNAKVSLIPAFGNVTGVTTKGLAYPLQDAVLEAGSTLGISNEFSGQTAEVHIKTGMLLVIKSKD